MILKELSKRQVSILGLSFLGLVLVTGLFFIGYKLGQKQALPEVVGRSAPTSLVTPTPMSDTSQATPTAEWKIYLNKAYGYSIRYPSNLFLYAEGGESSRGVHITNYDETKLFPEGVWPGRLKIEIFAMPLSMYRQTPTESLHEWIEKQPTFFRDANTAGIKLEDFSIGTQKAIKLVKTYWDNALLVIYVMRPDHLLIISGSSTSETDQNLVEVILNSIRLD